MYKRLIEELSLHSDSTKGSGYDSENSDEGCYFDYQPYEHDFRVYRCKEMLEKNFCPYGDTCKYAHSEEQLRYNSAPLTDEEKQVLIIRSDFNRYKKLSKADLIYICCEYRRARYGKKEETKTSKLEVNVNEIKLTEENKKLKATVDKLEKELKKKVSSISDTQTEVSSNSSSSKSDTEKKLAINLSKLHDKMQSLKKEFSKVKPIIDKMDRLNTCPLQKVYIYDPCVLPSGRIVDKSTVLKIMDKSGRDPFDRSLEVEGVVKSGYARSVINIAEQLRELYHRIFPAKKHTKKYYY